MPRLPAHATRAATPGVAAGNKAHRRKEKGEHPDSRLTGEWGLRRLGAWLLAMAVRQRVPTVAFSGSAVVPAVLGGAAGVLILLDR
jgi:hypothetical protein